MNICSDAEVAAEYYFTHSDEIAAAVASAGHSSHSCVAMHSPESLAILESFGFSQSQVRRVINISYHVGSNHRIGEEGFV